MRNLPTDRTWRRYGEKAPYFGVFGQAEFLNKNLDDDRLSFYFTSGEKYVEELFSVVRTGIDPDFAPEKILDFGCGPGRMVIPFSRKAREVYGLDVSEKMLEEARKNCAEVGVKNAVFRLSDDQLSGLSEQKFDLIHSFIVLQHLNTKRGEKLIAKLIDHLAEGGVGALHVTYADSVPGRNILNFFRYKIPYLYLMQRVFGFLFFRRPMHGYPQMQMNNYDLNRIYRILQDRGVEKVISVFTKHFGYLGISLYFRMPEDKM